MRTFKTNLLGLALAGLILGACSQTGTYETADLMNGQAAAEKAGFKLNPFGTSGENARTYSATDCEEFCIDPENPEYSVQTSTISNNSGPQTRVFTYAVYNTLTGFQLDWSYTASNNSGRKLKITVSGAGFTIPQSYTTNQLNGSGGTNQNPGTVNGSFNFPFTATWAACGVVTVVAEILDGDNVLVSGPLTTTYSLIGECSDCDEETFSYDATVADTDLVNIVFTYNSSEALQNAEVKFTFPQIEDVSVDGKYIAPDEKEYSVNNNGNNTVFTWVGDISCKTSEAETFVFEVPADCNASGKAQIWTDTSVNGVSVKNENTKNIRFYCSDQTIEETNEED